jgi:hypothetical protein
MSEPGFPIRQLADIQDRRSRLCRLHRISFYTYLYNKISSLIECVKDVKLFSNCVTDLFS